MARFNEINAQYFDDAGDPLSNGKIYFYETGTTTLKDTFSDINQTIANTNPVILTAAGRQPNIFFSGTAKSILVDKNDVQILVRDPVGQTASVFGDGWVATKIYSADAVVLGSDGQYYRSLAAGNQNNDPTSTSGYWTLLYSVEWNSGITYQEGAVVTYDGEQYQSLQNTNLNNNPSSATAYWVLLSFAWLSTRTYAINENAVGTDGILYTSLQNSNTGNDPATSPAYWVGTSAAAAASATAAANSATAAAASETAAETAETNAAASETAAAASETAAAASESAAATSATNASNSASAASTSETNAAASETAAASSASAASTSETNAAASASAASTSETNAAASETAAAASETAAAASESAAATSETNAANSASAASTSASNASTSETNAAGSATAAASSATAAAGSATAAAGSATDAADKYDEFDDRYLGEKASDPTLDNDGNALITGALYFNTSTDAMKVYTGSVWQDVAPVATTVTLSQVTDFPTQSGQSGKYLTTNGTVPNWETLTTDPTLGTLTKTFTTGESSTINLTSSVLAPVVSVTKEVPQSGVTNNNWDVNSTTENYTRLDSAYDTTLDFSGSSQEVDTLYTFQNSLSLSAQTSNVREVFLSSDGTKLYIVDDTNDQIDEYSLSTAYDVSTSSYTSSFSVATQTTSPRGLFFKPDGTVMYVSGNDNVYQYALSTAWDISSASYSTNKSIGGYGGIDEIYITPDGTKLYFYGVSSTSYIWQFNMSTAWNIATANYSAGKDISANVPNASGRGLWFNSTGTRAYVAQTSAIKQFNLSTAWNLATLSFSKTSQTFNTGVMGFYYSSDFLHLYVCNNGTQLVYEYLNPPTSLALGTGSFASADVGKTIEANSGEFVLTATDGSYVETTAPTSYAQVASGSWEMYGVVYNAADGDLQLSGGLFNAFDVDTASYVQNFSVSAQDTSPWGIAFNTDGTKMFVTGEVGRDVNEYNLSTAFDTTTATFVDSFNTNAQESQPLDVAFNTNGTKMFIVGGAGQDINEYILSTGFDVSTSTFVDSFSVSSQDTDPQGLSFNLDGTKMFVLGDTNNSVYQYTLSTGFDVSTASYDSVSFSVASQETNPQGLAFNTNGTKMFVVGYIGDDVNQYALSSGFDLSTASYEKTFSISSQDTTPRGMTFNNDGTKMFIVGATGQDINEYSLGLTAIPTGYQPVHTTASIDSTYWTDINSMTADQNAGTGNVYYAISTDDRTTWTVIDNTDGERDIVRNNAGTWQYNSNGTYASETWTNATTNTELATLAEAMDLSESTPYDLANATYTGNMIAISDQSTSPANMYFKSDGLTMYVVARSGDSVYQYTLSTAWDLSTASYASKSFYIGSQEANPRGLHFKSDGTKMYVCGNTSGSIFQYTLSTAWDVSTASYDSVSQSLSSQTSAPYGLFFKSDGTKMFLGDGSASSIYEYGLSTAWDLSTLSYSQTSPTMQTSVQNLWIKSDGTLAYVASSGTVYQYSMSTAWDVSTISYDSITLDASAEMAAASGIWAGDSGGKLYMVNASVDDLFEYNLAPSQPVTVNQMDKTQLDAVTDPNHIALGDDLDLSIIFNMTSGTTVPSSDGVAINYDANILNQGAVLGTDYNFDAPAGNKVRITAINAANYKVRVV